MAESPWVVVPGTTHVIEGKLGPGPKAWQGHTVARSIQGPTRQEARRRANLVATAPALLAEVERNAVSGDHGTSLSERLLLIADDFARAATVQDRRTAIADLRREAQALEQRGMELLAKARTG
jgi:hypothetical protein